MHPQRSEEPYWLHVIYDEEPPTIIASELPENSNISITNVADHLWPEIVKTYIPERMKHTPPATFVEHYPPIGERGRIGKQEYSEVIFERTTPRIVWQGREQRLTYGEPDWRHIEAERMREMTGGSEPMKKGV